MFSLNYKNYMRFGVVLVLITGDVIRNAVVIFASRDLFQNNNKLFMQPSSKSL